MGEENKDFMGGKGSDTWPFFFVFLKILIFKASLQAKQTFSIKSRTSQARK